MSQTQNQGTWPFTFPYAIYTDFLQCDEGRPGCRKCAQIRKPCPGYPFSIELHIRPDTTPHNPQPAEVPINPPVQRHESLPSSQNTFFDIPSSVRSTSTPPVYTPAPQFRADVFHPQAPRETRLLSIKDETYEQDYDFNLLDAPQYRAKSISPPPKYDVQHQATCFFLNLFSFQASKLYGIPVLDFLPDMIGNATENVAIQYASKAVSRMTLADRYSGYDTRLQTSDDYAKALNSVANTMSDVNQAVTDEAVTAVWLLGLYEVGCTD